MHKFFFMYLFLFITLYMFRAQRAHHRERQIVSIQPLVTVGGRASRWSLTKKLCGMVGDYVCFGEICCVPFHGKNVEASMCYSTRHTA